MKFFKSGGNVLPNLLQDVALNEGSQREGASRREFLAMATTFGATAATAYAMLGMNTPVMASEIIE